MTFRAAFMLAAPFALAACANSDKASTEAEADTVEIPANEALQTVTETPVADPSANAVEPPAPATPEVTEQDRIQAAGDSAADTAAAAADAAAETATDTSETEGQ